MLTIPVNIAARHIRATFSRPHLVAATPAGAAGSRAQHGGGRQEVAGDGDDGVGHALCGGAWTRRCGPSAGVLHGALNDGLDGVLAAKLRPGPRRSGRSERRAEGRPHAGLPARCWRRACALRQRAIDTLAGEGIVIAAGVAGEQQPLAVERRARTWIRLTAKRPPRHEVGTFQPVASRGKVSSASSRKSRAVGQRLAVRAPR